MTQEHSLFPGPDSDGVSQLCPSHGPPRGTGDCDKEKGLEQPPSVSEAGGREERHLKVSRGPSPRQESDRCEQRTRAVVHVVTF